MSAPNNLIDIKVPDIGDFDEVTVIEVLVKAGDVVKAEQSLITVTSSKSPMSGTFISIRLFGALMKKLSI